MEAQDLGLAWTGNRWDYFKEHRTVKRGRHKGKVKIRILATGRLVFAGKIRRMPAEDSGQKQLFRGRE